MHFFLCCKQDYGSPWLTFWAVKTIPETPTSIHRLVSYCYSGSLAGEPRAERSGSDSGPGQASGRTGPAPQSSQLSNFQGGHFQHAK